MDICTDIASSIREVQYLLRKMRNEIDCCLKATLTVKTCLRELATALAEEEAEKLHMAAQDESIPLMDYDIVPKFDFVPEKTTLEAISVLEMSSPFELELTTTPKISEVPSEVFYGHFSLFFLPQKIGVDGSADLTLGGISYPVAVCENDSVIFTSVFVTKMALVGSSCPIQPFKVVSLFVPPPAKPPDKSINMLQMLDSHIISKLLKYVILHGLEGVLFVERSNFDMLSLVRSKHLPTWISSLQTKVTLRIPSIDFLLPWVVDMSEIRQGNEQLWFENPSNFCNSTVCENAPETLHSDFNMPWLLNVSRCTLFDWKYAQLMLVWYFRFLNSYILLWIEENVQWLNVWWLFNLACNSPIRLEIETYVLGDLEEVRLFTLNKGVVAAAAKYRGDFEKILRAMRKEVEEIDTTIILFIFEIYLFFSTRKTKGLMEAATLLKHMPYRGRLRCTDVIQLQEFQQYVEKNVAVGKCSYITEPSIVDTIRIFRGPEVKYDSHQDDKALVMAALLLIQYIVSVYLPDKATDFGDEVCANVEVHTLASEKDKASKAHVAGGSFTVNRDASNANLDKENKNTLFFKKNQLPFCEERRLQDISKKHYEFIIIYYHMSMTKLRSYYCGKWLDSGQIYESYSDIGVSYVFTDIFISLSREPSRTWSSYKEVKQLIELWVRDYWCLVILEENDQRILNENNTIIDIHTLQSIHKSSYVYSFVKGLSTGSISYLRGKMHSSENLFPGVVKNVFQSQGFVILAWESLHMITIVHWTCVESEDEKKTREELKTKFEGLCQVLKNVLGSIGVDKTELVKPLTDQLFDGENFLISIDMHENREHHSMGRLIGDPPDYVDHKDGGEFTEVSRQLYYIVTLEVVEEGHQSESMFAQFLSELLIQHEEIASANVLPQRYDPTHGARPIRTCLTLLFKMPLWNDRDKAWTILVAAAFGRNELSYFHLEKKGEHVDEALKSKEIPVIFLAEFGQVNFYQLLYRELPIHMYGSYEEQLIIHWTKHSPDSVTWKRIASFRHEFITFDLEDKVTFDRGSNVTRLISKQGTTYVTAGRKRGQDNEHKGTTYNKEELAPVVRPNCRPMRKSEHYSVTAVWPTLGTIWHVAIGTMI